MSTYKHLSIVVALASGLAISLAAGVSEAEDTGPEASSIFFTAPEPNAHYPDAPAQFDATITVYQGGLDTIASVEFSVDGEVVGSEACDSTCTWPVELEMGMHTLSAVADTGAMTSRDVYVAVDPPPPPDDSADGDTGGGANDAAGSGCSQTGGDSPWALLALPALLGLILGRRRDRA